MTVEEGGGDWGERVMGERWRVIWWELVLYPTWEVNKAKNQGTFIYSSIALTACWMCMINCSGVPCDHTDTLNSTLPGRVSLIVLAVESTVSWSSSFSGCMRLVASSVHFLARTPAASVHLGLPCSASFSLGMLQGGSNEKGLEKTLWSFLYKWHASCRLSVLVIRADKCTAQFDDGFRR